LVGLDTSALVEFLRQTGSAVDLAVVRLRLDPDVELAITEVVLMEVLAGARNPAEATKLRNELHQLTLLRLDALRDYEEAAGLYRTARRNGVTVRKMTDCLIAVPIIRAGASLLHNDADFDHLAACSPLRIEPVEVQGA